MAARHGADRSAPRNSHDSLFRALFDDPARAADFLRCHLPESILCLLADESPVLMDGVFVDDSLGNRQSDRLLRVRLRSGEHDYIQFLIEHASSPDPNMALRLLRYQLLIWERENEARHAKPGRLTPVIALVVYHGKTRWNAALSLADMMMTEEPALRDRLCNLEYWIVDLGRIPDDQLARDPDLKALLLALKYRTRKPVHRRVLNRIGKLVTRGSALEKQICQYILREFDVDRADLQAALGEEGEKLLGQLAESFVDEGIAKGLAQGLAQGREEGRVEGRASILNRQLEGRFGRLPSTVRERVRSATVQELDSWADSVLDAPTLEAVFRDPPGH